MTLDDFLTTFSSFLTEKIMDSSGNIRKENLISVLTQLKIIGDNCGIVEEYSDEKSVYIYQNNLCRVPNWWN